MIDALHTIALGACNTVYTLPHHPDALALIQAFPDLIPSTLGLSGIP